MASTFGIVVECALDVCDDTAAHALPTQFKSLLLDLSGGTDPRVWQLCHIIVAHNLFPVFDAFIRDGLQLATARDGDGRNALFYATFALTTGTFAAWIAYFIKHGARPHKDVSGNSLDDYVSKYCQTYTIDAAYKRRALQVLYRIKA